MVFILGGRGFVGSAYARVCNAAGREFRVIDRENYASLTGRSCRKSSPARRSQRAA